MDKPIEIMLRGISPSRELERHIGEEVRRLDDIYGRIRSCRVVAETQRAEKGQSARLAVRLIITLPGTELVVNREHASDVYAAVREAFAAAGRQIKDHIQRSNPRSRG